MSDSEQQLWKQMKDGLDEQVSPQVWRVLRSSGVLETALGTGGGDAPSTVARLRDITWNIGQLVRQLERGGLRRHPHRAALSAAVASRVSASDRWVSNYRVTYLDGQVLRPRDVDAWLTSSGESVGHPASLSERPLSPDELKDLAASSELRASQLAIGRIGQSVTYVPVTDIPALEELKRLATQLANDWPWRVEEAAWFVLTGEPPDILDFSIEVRPAMLGNLRHSELDFPGAWRIRIEIDPMMPPTEVARRYREFRERISKRTGRRPENVSDKTAHLAFIAAYWERTSYFEEHTWDDAMRLWNALCDEEAGLLSSDWTYRTVATFRRDVPRAKQRILFPGYISRQADDRQLHGAESAVDWAVWETNEADADPAPDE